MNEETTAIVYRCSSVGVCRAFCLSCLRARLVFVAPSCSPCVCRAFALVSCSSRLRGRLAFVVPSRSFRVCRTFALVQQTTTTTTEHQPRSHNKPTRPQRTQAKHASKRSQHTSATQNLQRDPSKRQENKNLQHLLGSNKRPTTCQHCLMCLIIALYTVLYGKKYIQKNTI